MAINQQLQLANSQLGRTMADDYNNQIQTNVKNQSALQDMDVRAEQSYRLGQVADSRERRQLFDMQKETASLVAENVGGLGYAYANKKIDGEGYNKAFDFFLNTPIGKMANQDNSLEAFRDPEFASQATPMLAGFSQSVKNAQNAQELANAIETLNISKENALTSRMNANTSKDRLTYDQEQQNFENERNVNNDMFDRQDKISDNQRQQQRADAYSQNVENRKNGKYGSSISVSPDGKIIISEGGADNGLTKPTVNILQKQQASNLKTISSIDGLQKTIDAGTQNVVGGWNDIYNFGNRFSDRWLGMSNEEFMERRKDIETQTFNYVQAIRTQVTGQAAADKELQRIQNALLNIGSMGRAEIMSNLAAAKKVYEKAYLANQQVLKDGFPPNTQEFLDEVDRRYLGMAGNQGVNETENSNPAHRTQQQSQGQPQPQEQEQQLPAQNSPRIANDQVDEYIINLQKQGLSEDEILDALDQKTMNQEGI